MQVSCLQENLAKGLSIVGRAVASRSTLPVLSNVLIATDNGQLKLSATNLEIGINCWVGAKIIQEGAVTVPARLLGEFVNSLPPERIDLKLDESTQTLNLRCARFESNIKGIDAQEFPIVPTAANGGDAVIKLEPSSLRAMIDQVVFAAATDESRPILTGVLVQFNEDNLIMAAADGFRLSVKATTLKQNFGDMLEIIPKGYATRSVMDTGSLLKAVRVSHLFARDSANIVKLEITPTGDELMNGRITLVATSAELGDNVADVDASIEGNPMEIAFNAKYLIDVLSIIDSPQVVLETSAASSPGVLRLIGDDKFTHVIMPMHISR
ncbi:MAG: DNA polymerase III subunit beta [Chloroflexi bacterium]|nr:DNA polymerase III subunit beta [Chloroflexota bacterium]